MASHPACPEASVFPSGLKATAVTGPASPRRVPRWCGCWADSGDRAKQVIASTADLCRIPPGFDFLAGLLSPTFSRDLRDGASLGDLLPDGRRPRGGGDVTLASGARSRQSDATLPHPAALVGRP